MPHKKGRFSAPGSEQSIPLHVQNLDAKADLLTESYPIVLTDAVTSETIFSSGGGNLPTRRVESNGSVDSEGIKEFWLILYDHFKNAKAHETYINSALDNDSCKIKNLSKKCHNILE